MDINTLLLKFFFNNDDVLHLKNLNSFKLNFHMLITFVASTYFYANLTQYKEVIYLSISFIFKLLPSTLRLSPYGSSLICLFKTFNFIKTLGILLIRVS